MTGAINEIEVDRDPGVRTFSSRPSRSSGIAPFKSRQRSTENLVVIGNGPVGFKFCERLTELNGLARFQVTVFGEERIPAYNRVQLTQAFLAGEEQLQMASREWYEENNIELFTGNSVIAIDRQNRKSACEIGFGNAL